MPTGANERCQMTDSAMTGKKLTIQKTATQRPPLALIGLPQDNNSTFLTGPRLAPPLIRAAMTSPSANMFAETGTDLGQDINADGGMIGLWQDAGDLALRGLSGKPAFDAIHDGIADRLADGQAVISLGGDHSVTWPAVMAHAAQHQGLTILHLDAHPDLYDDMEGNPFSHASPFARIMEDGGAARLIQMGVRTLNAHQRAQVERFSVDCHEMRHAADITEISIDGPVYLSIDLDVLDPAFAPGVSHHEAGGMSVRDVLHIIQNFGTHSGARMIGGDLVELNPERDVNGVTAMVAAKIVKEMMARCLDDISGG